MTGPKKKRTILMDEDPSKVTGPSLSSRVKSFGRAVSKKIHPVRGGIGGKLFKKKTPPKMSISYAVGAVKGVKKKPKSLKQALANVRLKVKF